MSEPSSLKKLQILDSISQFCKQYGPEMDPIRTHVLLQSLKTIDNREEILTSLNDIEKEKINTILEIELESFALDNTLKNKLSTNIEKYIQNEWSKNSLGIFKKLIVVSILIGILYIGSKSLFFPDYWKVSYFSNKELQGKPFGVYYEQDPSHNWGMGAPKKGISYDNFSARFESNIIMSEKDTLTFKTIADDGIRIYVDEELILNFWIPQNSVANQVSKDLDIGHHKIRIEYFEATNGAILDFKIESTKEGSYKLSPPN